MLVGQGSLSVLFCFSGAAVVWAPQRQLAGMADFEVSAMASFSSQLSSASRRAAGQSAVAPPVKMGQRSAARHDVSSLGKTLEQHASALDQTLQVRACACVCLRGLDA